jgi:hypothetical protein
MNKAIKLGLSSLLTAGAVGAMLLQAPAASANPGFVCPAGSDTIQAPISSTQIAGTVCVFSGTSAYRSVDLTAGWRAEVKDLFGSPSTDVRFYNPTNGGKVEVIYRSGKLQIKR